MRLYLAVAVLVLALVAYTEAQDNTMDQITRFGQDMAERAKDTFEKIRNSDVVTNTRNWFEESAAKLKAKFAEIGQ